MILKAAVLLYILVASTAYAAEPLFAPAEYDAGLLEEGGPVSLEITLRNRTGRPLRILSLETSCGCTEAVAVSEVVAPEGYGLVRVTIDTTGKIGRFVKTVEILTDASEEPFVLTVRGEVRHSGDGSVDAGVIFREGCRRCHLGRNVESKRGEILFNAVCYVCHREYSSLRGLSEEALREVISRGLPGTSMPGFSEAEGGPLTRGQIDSLVEFLRK